MGASERDKEQGGGPPWIQPSIQHDIAWRDGDIVISVPPKSGTTWTMNIVFQLLNAGRHDFRDIYEEVSWIEFLSGPDETSADVCARLDAWPASSRRAFKTHSAPPRIPFLGSGDKRGAVKYIVVFRNPEEALVSLRPFFEKHTDEWLELWGVPREALCRPDFRSFYEDVIDPGGLNANAFFGFLRAWWPLREAENVLFLHFADMKRDHEGAIRKIAAFLEVEPTQDAWARIFEYTSFDWMKRYEDKFEAGTVGQRPILMNGAMIRKGQAGAAREDGMTETIARHLAEIGDRVCEDKAALEWFYRGTL